MTHRPRQHKSMFSERAVIPYRRPSPLRGLTWLVVLFIGILLGWSFIAKVPEVARTRGQVEPLGDLTLVQSLEGGQVIEIMAKEGQSVDAGQPLIRFEPLKTETDVKQLTSRNAFLRLESERLRAFVENDTPDFSAFRERYAIFVKQQEQLLAAQRTERDGQIRTLQEQLQQKRQTKQSLNRELLLIEGQLKSATSITDMYKELSDKKIATRLELIGAEQRESEFRKELSGIRGAIQVLNKEMREIDEKKKSVRHNLYTDAQRTRAAILSELEEVDQRLNERRTTLDRLLISSPIKGIIKSMQFTNPGAVVNPSEVLAEIVPLDVGLVIEVQISPRDIGFVHVGQPVMIRVDAYDYSRYGALEGQLTRVSPTTFTGPGGEPYYIGEVTPKKQHLGDNPKKSILLPGMTAEVDIITGEKTIFEYLLKPVFTLTNQSFTER